MGCVACKILNPRPPDPTIRHVWHIRGMCIDGKDSIERRPPGIIYICNEKLCYKPRQCLCGPSKEELEIELANISAAFSAHQFSSDNVSRFFRKLTVFSEGPRGVTSQQVVDITTNLIKTPSHFGIITNDSDAVCNELNEIIRKHRQKPKIMQFNSVDLEGVEID